MRTPLPPRASLFASTALSATYPVSLKLLYAAEGAPLSPALVTALRFSLMAGGAVLLMRMPTEATGRREVDAAFWLAAAELGFWACAGAQFNALGLQEISVIRGTILLTLINVFTPLLSSLIGTDERQRRVPPRIWAACVVALVSAATALAGEAPPLPFSDLSLSNGDAFVLAAACCFATNQVRLGSLVVEHPPARLAAARLQTQAAFSLPFLALAGGAARAGAVDSWASGALDWAAELSPTQVALIGGSAALATSGTLLQFEGQRTVPAASAQPIYASAPILTALWAFVVLREPVTISEALGGLGVCAATALAAVEEEPG